MFIIHPKSIQRFSLTAVVLAIGSALFAQNQTDGQEEIKPKPTPEKRVRTDLHGDPLPRGAVTRLGTLRFRAPAEIVALAYAPDGKTIAVSSYAGLFLFDAASGKRLRRLDWNFNRSREISPVFSPDSQRLAVRAQVIVGDPKGKRRTKDVVRIWDLASDRRPQEFDAAQVVWLGWSGNNEPLAVCLETEGLRLHELGTGRSRRFACQNLPKSSFYLDCAYTPAGRAMAVVDEQNMIHVWDTTSGRERCTIKPRNVAFIRSWDLSPDGRILACLVVRNQAPSDGEAIQFWDTTTGKTLRTLVSGQNFVFTILFAPDGKTLATAGWREIRFWDVTTGKQRSRSEGPASETEKVAFSGDGKTLATAERSTAAFHLWDVRTGKRKPEPPGQTGRPYGTFSPDGRHLYTTGGSDGTIHLWNTAAGNSLLQIQRRVRDIAFSADGRALFSLEGNLWVSDSASGEKQHEIKLHDPDRPDTYQQPDSIYLSADRKTLVAFSHYYPKKNGGPQNYEKLITGWDTATYKQLFRRSRLGGEYWIAVSADCRMLAVPGSKLAPEFGKPILGVGPMRLEDVVTGALLVTFPVLEGQTWPLAFSPDGRLLASNNSNYRLQKQGDPSSTGQNLRLWEIATATEVLSLPHSPPGSIQYRAAFSPNGRLLAMAAPQQQILIYDLAAGRDLRRFKDFGAEVTWLAFSPDGRRLASGLEDSTLLIWDMGSRPTQEKGKLGAEDAAQAWTDLAGRDGPRAFRARWALAAAPETAVSFLQKRLQPVQPADSKRLSQLIADLDDKRFLVRQQAQKELEDIGELAATALKKALAEKSSLEVRQRIDGLLGAHISAKFNSPFFFDPHFAKHAIFARFRAWSEFYFG
jgi:WD40 repeat protein